MIKRDRLFGPRFFLLIPASLLALLLSWLGITTAARNIFGWLFVCIGAAYFLGGGIYLWASWRRDQPLLEETTDRSFWLILPGFLAVFYAPPLEYINLTEILPRSTIMQVLGLVLFASAILMRAWTRLALRGLYTGHVQVKVDHHLIQQGPYRFIRHPGYAGFILMASGISIGYSSLVGLAAIPLLMLPGLVYRIKVEEKLLLEQFGDEYRRYAAHTNRLLPGLW